MRVVVHQPHFLPWMGFFSKLAWSDGYIALDDALFRKRHFQDRVCILDMHGYVCWLSVPTGQNFGSKISMVRLNSTNFLPSVRRTLDYSYARTPFYVPVSKFVNRWFDEIAPVTSLADLNILLIEKCCEVVFPNRSIKMWRASDLRVGGDATDRVIGLSKAVGANEILLGKGASLDPKVHDLSRIERDGISVFVQDFENSGIVYPQVRRAREGFVSRLSIIDALFNIGVDQVIAMLSNPALAPKELI